MDIQDLLKNIKVLTEEQIERKLDELVKRNYHFSNLDEKNKKTVLNLINEYKDSIKHGIAITAHRIQRDIYPLYENRLSLGLTKKDIDDLKNILNAFKA
ncbi:hypothetical protein COT98_04185 [Candidatus Falkowbacteria bacterium CG10_big_fil_rev_8_21_14_0_10_39_9]|uniref:Uncharacterized protein n=1 Tax=Candidatus Falkowbacteria bacterium CG10_big_fil_rev_8_21_14_0_10_39_9 TaxID=1974566 RepID=A0A2M6WNI6_9BACT|nr:MAG: hypothetical protein COT98_04185 [Candidatus Falkowbacteria bacterium CG10_big_fil_rev_8_21_14_0_10_39_9]